MPKVKSFEKHGDIYEEWFVRNKFAYESELQAIRAMLPKDGTGIEIGVGTGRFAAPLDIKLGVEPSKTMRKIARKKGIEVVNGVAESIPFDNNQFDFALMVTTICFLDDIETSFKEVFRVLKSKALFIIGFIDRNSPIGKLYQKRKNLSIFYKEAKFYSVDEIIFYLKKSGFRELSFMQTIYKDLRELKDIEPVKEGYGEGSFVVVKAFK